MDAVQPQPQTPHLVEGIGFARYVDDEATAGPVKEAGYEVRPVRLVVGHADRQDDVEGLVPVSGGGVGHGHLDAISQAGDSTAGALHQLQDQVLEAQQLRSSLYHP